MILGTQIGSLKRFKKPVFTAANKRRISSKYLLLFRSFTQLMWRQ